MPLTHTKELFAKALKGKYALGAFNVNNMELIQAIVEACEEEKAPLILQISKGARQYANPVYLKKLIEAAVSLSNVPIAVHLDHGDTFDLCKQCIDEGFTSVMIDASHEPFEKNAEITRKVVEYAHKFNASVESELGHLVGAQFDDGEEGGSHSTSGHYTNPDEAVKFVKETGCDSLAVAIGNSHGALKFKGEQTSTSNASKPSKRRSWMPGSVITRWCFMARPACEVSGSRDQQIRRQDARCPGRARTRHRSRAPRGLHESQH